MGRHKILVVLLGVVALASSFWFLLDVIGTAVKRARTLSAGDFEARFANFPPPSPDAVFGYLSDNQPNDPRALFEYHLTQYVLAPAIIKPTANLPLVVVNYHTKDLDIRMLQANHLVPYREYGNGVALCRIARR